MSDEPRKFDFDLDAYVQRVRTGPCPICRIVAEDPEIPAHVIHRPTSASSSRR